MFDKNSQKHKDNLAFIAKSLSNKPATTDLFVQIIEFNARNLVEVEVVFPKRKIPGVEFLNEHIANNANVIPDSFKKSDQDTKNIINKTKEFYF